MLSSPEPAGMSATAKEFAELSSLLKTKLDGKSSDSPKDNDHAHVCNICFKRFKRTEHLKRHTRSHEPGPYLECDICERSFLRSDSLRRHKKIHKRAREEECTEATPISEIVGSNSSSSKQSRPRLFNRACRQCAKARVRCDGAWPCERCTVSEVSCERVKKKRSTVPEQQQQQHQHDHASDYCAASSASSSLSDSVSEKSSRLMEESSSGDSSCSDNASQADLDAISIAYSTPKEEDFWQPNELPHTAADFRAITTPTTTSWPVSEYDLTWWPQADAVAGMPDFNALPVQQDQFLHCGMDGAVFNDSHWVDHTGAAMPGVGECWSPEGQVSKMAAMQDLQDYDTAGGMPMQAAWCAPPIVAFQPIYG